MPQPQHNRAKANVPSIVLESNENEVLFQTIGQFCTTLATGVVQLYLADGADRTRWNKRCCGVACFIKDASQRSFYIRVYDIKKQQMIWEQELYSQFIYKTPREYFHTFEADGCQAGMNFTSEDEAMKFRKAVEGKLHERHIKKQERRRQTQRQSTNRGAAPQQMGQSASNTNTVTTNLELNRNNNTSTGSLNSLKKKNKEKKDSGEKKKLTKADIGLPSNFIHVSHVGWDPDKGFDMNNLEPDMQKLFQSVGIRPDDNVDKDTLDFIYDFVEKHGGIEAVKNELAIAGAGLGPPPSRATTAAAPPPPPSRSGHPPPPPPSRNAMPPPPPPSRSAAVPPPARNAAPPPPPPSRVGMHAPLRAPSAAPPPPPPAIGASRPHVSSAPPPPPPTSGGPPPPPPPPPAGGPPPPPPPPPSMGVPEGQGPGRGALLDAIRGGTTLKSTPSGGEAPSARAPDSRDQLLDSIRHGAKLKKVDATERPPSGSGENKGLVGALARALANRQKQIHGSDDEDDSDDDDDDMSDDDDWDD